MEPSQQTFPQQPLSSSPPPIPDTDLHQPSGIHLRPMTLVDILDRSLWMYRRYFVTFMLTVAVIEVPYLIIFSILTASSNILGTPVVREIYDTSVNSSDNPFAGVNWISIALALILLILHGVFLRNFQIAALTNAIAEAYLGKRPTISAAYRGVARAGISLTLSSVIIGMLSFILIIIGAIVFGGLFGGTVGIITLLGSGGGNRESANAGAIIIGLLFLVAIPCLFILAFIPLIYSYIRLAFTPQAIILEHAGPVQGLQRSWHLVHGAWLRSFGIIALLTIMEQFLVSGPATVLQVSLALAAINNPLVITLLTQVATVLLQILFMPIGMAGRTLLYFDLRVRKEGLDLEYTVRNMENAAQNQQYIPG